MNTAALINLSLPVPLLRQLCLWVETTPHPAALNMARDEALLHLTPQPLLRIYRWQAPALSFGCFVPWQEAEAARQGAPLEMVRRWTGGGIVWHGEGVDWTYSLIVPRHEPLARAPIAASYQAIHRALAQALNQLGVPASLADAPAPGLGGPCFAAPVAFDVMASGRKIAGAAQRRTRHGLLHQGSVQLSPLPETAATALAQALAEEVLPAETVATLTPVLAALPPLSQNLVHNKYAKLEWLRTPP